MATYTINTNTAQDRGITFTVNRINAERASETPPKSPVTAQQYVQAVFNRTLDDWTERADENERTTITEAYKNATTTQRAQIKNILGL